MKLVVGILKENEDKIQSYIDKGYHVEYIDKHVKIFGESLMRKELNEEEIKRIRASGYQVSSYYWIHLALISAKNKDKIVIADLQEEDNKKNFSKII